MGLNLTTAGYRTQTTVFIASGAALELILPADPRRWFLQINVGSPFTMNRYIFPGPYPVYTVGIVTQTFPLEFKYRDCPSIVAGEFYGGFSAGSQIFLTECLYVGE